MKKFRVVITIVAIVALITVGFLSAKLLDREDPITVNAASIEERLNKCNSLTTARLDYRGLIPGSC